MDIENYEVNDRKDRKKKSKKDKDKKSKDKKNKKSRRDRDDSEEEDVAEAPTQVEMTTKKLQRQLEDPDFNDSNDSEAQNSSVDGMAAPGRNNLDNMPYSTEKNTEVKSIGNMQGIKCCGCLDLEKGIKALMLVAFLDFLYCLGNMFFGLLFYVIGKSKELTVDANGQLVSGNVAVNKLQGDAAELLQKQQQLNLSDGEALKFGWLLGTISFVSLFPLGYIIFKFRKHQLQQSEEDREQIVKALDIWIYKSTLWYLIVCVSFMVIMLDQESNQLLTLIITGITTFVMLFWWRTTFTDSLDRIESYKLEESLADRSVSYQERREELDAKIKDREQGQYIEEYT